MIFYMNMSVKFYSRWVSFRYKHTYNMLNNITFIFIMSIINFSEVSYGDDCAGTAVCVDPFTECNVDNACACVTGYTEIGYVCYQGLYNY